MKIFYKPSAMPCATIEGLNKMQDPEQGVNGRRAMRKETKTAVYDEELGLEAYRF